MENITFGMTFQPNKFYISSACATKDQRVMSWNVMRENIASMW